MPLRSAMRLNRASAALVVPQHQLAEAQEGVMHIMRRLGRGDAIDEGFGHGALLAEAPA